LGPLFLDHRVAAPLQPVNFQLASQCTNTLSGYSFLFGATFYSKIQIIILSNGNMDVPLKPINMRTKNQNRKLKITNRKLITEGIT